MNRSKEYYINNKESIKDYQKQYRENNPLTEDKKTKNKRISKQYRKNMTDYQKEEIKEYKKMYYEAKKSK